MLISETVAHSKWCPMVRVEGANRFFNTNSDGFENSSRMYHCLGNACMAWREFRLSHVKGGELPEHHGYCGLAGRIELE
jgi:hypothetical protein